jgi:transcriptional regulator with XRE-family HTH domain
MREWAMNPVLTGKQIKIWRRRLHLSQDRLLDALWDIGEEVSRNSLSSWESGKKRPTLEHLLALCHIFHCSLNELVVTNRSLRGEEEGGQPLFFIMMMLFVCSCFGSCFFWFSNLRMVSDRQLFGHTAY